MGSKKYNCEKCAVIGARLTFNRKSLYAYGVYTFIVRCGACLDIHIKEAELIKRKDFSFI